MPGLPTGHVGLAAFFGVGLLGSAHCLGMCGPLVTLYGDRMPGDDARGPTTTHLRQHALFNVGRTLAYAALGAAAGALGALAFDVAALVAVGAAVRGATGVAVGLLVAAAGVRYMTSGVTALPSVPGLSALSERVGATLRAHVDEWVGGPRIVGLGAVHGLLPCPLLYPAYLYAFGTGSAVEGGAALAALGLGTVPTVFAFGTVLGSLGTEHRVRLHRALGAAFVVQSAIPIWRGLRLLGVR